MRSRRFPWFSWLLVVAGAVIMVVPFAEMVSTSLKSPGEYGRLPYRFLPQHVDVSNYIAAFRSLDIPLLARNSVVMAGASVLSVLVTSSLAGYALAKLRFPGRPAIFRFVLATMMFPPFLLLIPDFLLMTHWPLVGGNNVLGEGGGGMTTHVAALFLPFLVSGFGVFLMRQFIMGIPNELLEAARIDGASELRLWWSVVLPQTKPPLITLGLLTFVQTWNEYVWPLLIASVNNNLMTLPVGVQLLQAHLDPNRTMPIVMAGLVISTVPVLLTFMLLQKYYIRGAVLSGLK